MKKQLLFIVLPIAALIAAGLALFLSSRPSLYDYAHTLPESCFVDGAGTVWVCKSAHERKECLVYWENARAVPFWVRKGDFPKDEDMTTWDFARAMGETVMLCADGSLWRVTWDTGRTRFLRRSYEPVELTPAEGGEDYSLSLKALSGELPTRFSLQYDVKLPEGQTSENLRAALSVELCGSWYFVCEGVFYLIFPGDDSQPGEADTLLFTFLDSTTTLGRTMGAVPRFVPAGNYRVELYEGDGLLRTWPLTITRDGYRYTLDDKEEAE